MRRSTKLSPSFHTLLLAAAGLVCAGVLQAQDFAAKLVAQTGQVSIVRDGVPAPLFEGNQVRPQQIVSTGPDGYAKFQLADGSTFEIFPNSRVTFRAPGSGIRDLLNLWIGRVKVMIDHTHGPNFKDVNTPTAVISVRGTVFDVLVEDDDGTTLVSVDEGLVGVRNLTSFGPSVDLHPGQWIRVTRGLPLMGNKIDTSPVMRQILRAAQEAVYRTVYGRQGGPVGAGGGTSGGSQGDTKGKNGGSTGTGNTGSSGGSGTPPTGGPPTGAPPGGGGFFDSGYAVSNDAPAVGAVFAAPRARLKTWFPPFVQFFR